MARAHAAEMADDRRAGEVEIAQRVEHLVAHELVDVAQPLAFSTRSPLITTALSSEPPRARPAARMLIDLVQEAEGAGAADARS